MLKRTLAILVAAIALSGCSFLIKTPEVADYSNLNKLDGKTTRNDVALLLGTPQGSGTHVKNGSASDLRFYYGMSGEFSLSKAEYDSGTAFLTFQGDSLSEVIHFGATRAHPVSLGKSLSIKAVADSVVLGKSKAADIKQALGEADQVGRRVSKGVSHKVHFWDASQMQAEGSMKEKWLLLGYDSTGVVQDLMWSSSDQADIEALGAITETQVRQLSRLSVAGLLPYMEPTGLSTGAKLDPMQADALINTKPKNVKDIVAVLGKPSALGIKSFNKEEPAILSNWSFMKLEMKGEEHNFIPLGADDATREKLQGRSFTVMRIEQSRLMVAHTPAGEIKEIFWFRPAQ